MIKRYQDTYAHTLRVADTCVIVGAWIASYWVRFFIPLKVPSFLAVTKGLPSFSTYAALSPLVAALWFGTLTMCRAYEANRMLGRAREAELILRGHALGLLLFISVTYFFEDYRFSRLVLIYFALFGALGTLGVHLSLRTILRYLRRRGQLLRTTIAVGEGFGLEHLITRLAWYPELGLKICGVLTRENSEAHEIAGKPVLGTYSQVLEIIEQTRADEILISLPPTQTHETDRLLELLRDTTLDIRLVPDVHRFATIGCEVEVFDGLPIVRLNDSPVIGWGAILKRVTDAVVSAIGLVVVSPLLLIIAAAVRFSSPGPVLYAQERMSLDGQGFMMYKFRTMFADAEVASGAVWAKPDDQRCTRIGALLRRTSLDELPQLWNVLRGDMSLVGPRPERPNFVQRFRAQIPHYMLRHKVRAGITGWAQVNGWRGNTSLERRIECDLFYIKNWTYFLDIKILLMTLWKGFVHKNAY